MNKQKIMAAAAQKAAETMKENIGGPFGSAIVKDGEILCIASNSVLGDHDPTAHAEVNAIRAASRILGTHDLSGCELYATGYPCPMCMSAIIWANIKKVYISGMPKDAEKIGFRDDFIYRFIEGGCQDQNIVTIEPLGTETAVNLYETYASLKKPIY